uniref:Metalloendopeptidase n=1 Tax=Crassostrea virginica TaxID=6565 RepID=A0A8B8BVL2_CRAVI|nr:fibropellin-1-like [Crassostrea virginica]
MTARYSVWVGILGVLCIALVRTERPASDKDVRLREFLEALEKYVTKKENARDSSRHQLTSRADNSLEQDKLNPEDEDDAERQSVLIDDKTYKPNNLNVNKQQEEDDNLDHHPKPPITKPVVGVKKALQSRNFGISSSTLWTGGVIPYEIDANTFGTRLSQATQLVNSVIANIAATTCVKWRLKTDADTYYVRIKGDEGGCWSYVGNVKFNGGQGLNLGNGCLSEYIVLHELHHAMGGLHEQQRNRRKYFVKINWENIQSSYNDQYALSQNTKNNEVYDYASILQYHLTAFTSNGKDTMTIADQDLEYLITNSKYVLSYYDNAEINKEYSCPTASCTLSCQNEGFRMQAVGQTTCKCQCPTGLKGATCEELDTDADCGRIITLSNGASEEIKMTSYTQGKSCTWLVKGESDSIIKATVTSVDLPFSSQNDCYHWLEFRDYLIGDDGKELCGKSTTAKTYTQAQIGKVSPFMIRFNALRSQTPGTGFTVKVEALKSGCMSSPCKTGSLCTEGPGDGTYTCACQNGLSGTNCDQFNAPSYNLCNHEDDFGTCLFDEDPSSDIRWNFNTRLCDWRGCGSGVLTRGSGYQFLTLTPYYDSVPWNYGSKAAIKTSAQFTAVDRCLSLDYALGNYVQGDRLTELNVYVEGTGKAKTKLQTYKTTTDYNWRTATVSIEAVENLVITIEGVIGPQLIGVDNISLRPGLCTNTPCNPNPCLNSGTCDDSSPPTGSKYVCTCQAGFTGDRCENQETVNNCANTPCKNGGTCNPTASGYTCSCASGFTGTNCETVDSCGNNPCQNGGTCNPTASGYTCSCASGFTGTNCETVDSCGNNPCQNGGTCNPTASGYTCSCTSGFTGTNCETVDSCGNNPCQNGGTCNPTASGYTCSCASGFTGTNCETVDSCGNNPCQNGGTCNPTASGYTCSCASGFTGTNCETVDSCGNNPCQNGGTCNPTASGYTCSCASGFTGTNCETVDSCGNNPCQNGGSCNPTVTGYTCSCPSGFSGNLCEIEDFCFNSPCKNGASCTSGTSTYSCQCTSAYTGTTCETLVTADNCDPDPCLNGGSCFSYDFGYYCQCPPSYTGLTCETMVTADNCDPDPCLNGGTCFSYDVGYYCQCPPNYTGLTCETPAPTLTCETNPCQNGGSCIDDDFGTYCLCPMEFSGERCEIPMPTDACNSSPCKHDSTCYSIDTEAYCICPAGYTGPYCETVDVDDDPCLSNPCENGGSCVETPNEENPYRCDCMRGFLGRNCEGYSCRFERRWERSCFLKTRRTRGWVRRRGRTPSRGTGPSRAYQGRFYLYFEASFRSAGKYNLNDTGRLPYKNATHCLSLHYHMYGSGMGKFSVMTYSPDAGYWLYAKVEGNQGNQWKHMEVNLQMTSNTRIVLQALRKNSFRSDIAIDDVSLMPYPCPDQVIA